MRSAVHTKPRVQYADPAAAAAAATGLSSPSHSPRSSFHRSPSPRHRLLTASPELVEPRSTPRARSRTRPAVPASAQGPSPSPIAHGASYRSMDRSSALFPGSQARHAAKAAMRPLESSGSAASSTRARPGPRASPVPSPSRLTSRTLPSTAPPPLGSPQSVASAPLVLALRAQWALVQQQLAALEVGGPALSPQSAAVREQELLRTLAALPAGGPDAAVAAAAPELAPYLLAFAVAPIPSARTQAVALAALQGLVESLTPLWGRVRAAEFVHGLYLGEHQGLEAMGMALLRALDERARDVDDLAAHAAVTAPPPRGHDAQALRRAELRTATIDSLTELLLCGAALCPAVGLAVLGQAALMRGLVQYLPEATPAQAATLSALLHTLLRGTRTDTVPTGGGLSRAEAAGILASYGAHHVVLDSVRRSVRATYSGRADVAAGATVTTLCVLLRVAAQLVSATGAYDVLLEEDHFSILLGQLLTVPWGDVVELTCLWIARLLAYRPRHGGPQLAANLMAKAEVPRVLTRLLGWREEATFSFATSAALCWRWLFLAAGSSRAAVEVAVAQPGILISFVHALLTNPLPRDAGPGQPHAAETASVGSAGLPSPTAAAEHPCHSHQARTLFTVELVVGLSACYAVGTSYTQAATHLLLLERLDAVLIQALRESVEEVMQSLDDSYFASLPPLVLESGTELAEVVARRMAADRDRARPTASASTTFIGKAPPSAAASRSSSTSSMGAQGRYRSELMRSRGDIASASVTATDNGATGEDKREGSNTVVSVPRHWRAVVSATWDLLLSGEPSRAVGGRGSSPHGTAPASGSLAPVGGRVRGELRESPTRLRGSSPRLVQRSSDLLGQHQQQTQAQRRGRSLRPPPLALSALTAPEAPPPLPHARCAVVQRARQLADGAGLYRSTMEAVLRLAHAYVGSGVVGESMLPITALAHRGEDGEATLKRMFESSAASLLLEEHPDRLLSVTASGRGALPRSPQLPNPWAPPPKVRPARRWHVDDLESQDVLTFAIAYETLVRDLAEAIAAVEAHVGWLRSKRRTCPMKALTRRVLLNDLYMNVYPKVHLFLQYIQHQVARSRAVLQLLAAEESDSGGGICIHSGNIIDVYAAVGACVGRRS